MIIIGSDFHPEFQQIAWGDTDTGEFREQPLRHRQEAETFERERARQATQVRVEMEASGHARWFRTADGRTALRVVDRRGHRETEQASTQAEDRSPGRPPYPGRAAGKSFSADLDTELGQP